MFKPLQVLIFHIRQFTIPGTLAQENQAFSSGPCGHRTTFAHKHTHVHIKVNPFKEELNLQSSVLSKRKIHTYFIITWERIKSILVLDMTKNLVSTFKSIFIIFDFLILIIIIIHIIFNHYNFIIL